MEDNGRWEMATSAGTLWIVATPIGTLGDLSPRAREILQQAAVILAEDTRRTRRLLTALGLEVAGRLQSFHDHNEVRRAPAVLDILCSGGDVALVSDAGTPVLSDPGFDLVRRARAAGYAVASVPGPSAFTAALAASGQPPLPAVLVGFLPPRSGARKRRLADPTLAAHTAVIFLSPHRLEAELADISAALGSSRPATLLAELSKKHERAEVGTLETLATGGEAGHPRGEYVLVVGPPNAEEPPEVDVDRETARAVYNRHLDSCGDRRRALKAAAAELGLGRREIYALLIENEDL